MRRILVLLLVHAPVAEAQNRRVEVAAFGGYQSGLSTSSRLGQLSVDPAPTYGALVDVRVRPDATIQLLYQRQDTVLDFVDNTEFVPTTTQFDLAIEYYQFGGTLEFGSERFRPNFVLSVGATRFHPIPEDIQDAWRFSVGVGGGFKQYLSDRVGVRVDGRVWSIFANTNGGFLCSLPGGCVVSIQADFLFQASATAGLFVTF